MRTFGLRHREETLNPANASGRLVLGTKVYGKRHGHPSHRAEVDAKSATGCDRPVRAGAAGPQGWRFRLLPAAPSLLLQDRSCQPHLSPGTASDATREV